jgi:hypothetical protein
MKRQLWTIGLAAISTFSVLSLSLIAQAATQRTITDQEPNNSEQQPQSIGTLTFDTQYTINGSVGQGGTDLVDNYSFAVGRAARYVTNLSTSGIAELRLYFNNSLIANHKPGQPIDRVLQPGNYRLEVFKVPSGSALTYGVGLITPPAPPISLTIVSAQAISDFDTGSQADFVIKPTIDSKAMPSKKIADDDTPQFNHTVTASVDPTKQIIPINLRLEDDDPVGAQLADINPDPTINQLQLKYIPSTGVIAGPNGRIGQVGETITVTGVGGKRASITFRFN